MLIIIMIMTPFSNQSFLFTDEREGGRWRGRGQDHMPFLLLVDACMKIA
jgi:hypothetical protein